MLEQKQILALSKLIIKDSASGQVLKDLFSDAGLWETEDFVSLDPCSCPHVCRPTGISRFFYLPIWEDYSKKDNKNVPEPPRSNLENEQKKQERFALIHQGFADRLAPDWFLGCAACSFDTGAVYDANITQKAMGIF